MTSTLSSLLPFWFVEHRDKWFGCPPSFDRLVSETYTSLYLSHDRSKPPSEMKPGEALATILLYDQIYRHLRRVDPDTPNYEAYALRIAQWAIETHSDLLLTPEQRCFLLMPLRHLGTVESLETCIERLSEYRSDAKVAHPIYDRFYRATMLRYGLLRSYQCAQMPYRPDEHRELDAGIHTILDLKSPLFSMFRYPLSPIDSSKKAELEKSAVGQALRKSIDALPSEKKNKTWILSVSGGVDSMVMTLFLKSLYPSQPMVAVCIDYRNRVEQTYEVQMVARCCAQAGIPLYVRPIEEIQRTRDRDREMYEELTREFRFEMYRRVCPDGGLVMLGHNKDDCLENLFSNVRKGQHYDNLFGMSLVSQERGVEIARPLLAVSKAEIVEEAQRLCIPYVYDSTPSWSERGQIRDRLLPAIRDFDPAILTGLVEMVETLRGVYRGYSSSIPASVDGLALQTIYENNHMDWWRRLFSRQGVYPSKKSLRHLIECVGSFEKREQRFDTLKIVVCPELRILLHRSRGVVMIDK